MLAKSPDISRSADVEFITQTLTTIDTECSPQNCQTWLFTLGHLRHFSNFPKRKKKWVYCIFIFDLIYNLYLSRVFLLLFFIRILNTIELY